MKQFGGADSDHIFYSDFNSPEELDAVFELIGFKLHSEYSGFMSWTMDYSSISLRAEYWLDRDASGRKYKNFKITSVPKESRFWFNIFCCLLGELSIDYSKSDNSCTLYFGNKDIFHRNEICIDMNIKKEEEGCDAI